MKLLAQATEFRAGIARIASAAILLTIGLGLAGAAIYIATVIPSKLLAVLVSGFGCMAGGGLCVLASVSIMDEMRQSAANEQARLTVENEKLRQDSSETQSKLHEVLRQRNNLDQQIEGLKRMRIDVNRWEEVLKLGMLEFDGQFTHFQRQKLIETNPKEKFFGLWTEQGEMHEYLGLCDVKFRALVGVDLMKIRIRVEGDRLIISGFATPFQSHMNVKKDWLLKEVRVAKTGGDSKDTFEVHVGHPLTADALVQQEGLVQERLNAGPDLRQIHSFLSKRSQEFVHRLLAPIGKEIVFNESDNQSGSSLPEFLSKHDQQIADQIKELEQQSTKMLALKN